jgi:hypothetical protein
MGMARREHKSALTEQSRDDETPAQTLDRNWAELLQELRVAQTGVQLLTGFLLTLPFQQRFTTLSPTDRRVYLTTVLVASFATTLLVAPVPLHRLLFRHHERAVMVRLAHVCALLGTTLLAAAIVLVNTLIFDVVVGRSAATVVTAVIGGLVLVLWLCGPLALRLWLGAREQDA